MTSIRRAPVRLLTVALLAALAGSRIWAQGPPAPKPTAPSSPSSSASDTVPLILSAPANLEEFLRRLENPDFVLLSGPNYKKLMAEASTKGPSTPRAGAVVTSVAVSGRATEDLASLTIKLGFQSTESGRHLVPIGLEGLQAISSVEENGKSLVANSRPKGGWEVELDGPGKHEVVVEAKAFVTQSGEERRLTIPIPVCSSTSLDLEVRQRIIDAVLGDRELVSVTPSLDGETSRVTSRLSPRDKIALTWRAESASSGQLPPLLSAEVELAINVDPDVLQIRSTWQISSARGISRVLSFTLDPADELVDVVLDNRTLPNEVTRDGKSAKLVINLPEPLRQGTSRRLKLETRRKLDRKSASRIDLVGFPLGNALIQTGAIAISKSRLIYVNGTAGRALRRIDPRTELPDDMRERPGTVLAYQFVDQPFELTLAIDPAPPRVRVEPNTTLSVENDRVLIDSWFEYITTRGQVYDLIVDLPRSVEIDEFGFGPKDVVASAEYAREEPNPTSEARERPRRLILHLTDKAREAGTFKVHLTGHQPLANAQKPTLNLFIPQADAPLGGLVALLSGPGVDVVPLKSAPEFTGGAFVPLDLDSAPATWIWPAGFGPSRVSTATWLRQSKVGGHLPVQVTRRPRRLSQETTVSVEILRNALEIEQETLVSIPFGNVRRLDFNVPPDLVPIKWLVDSPSLSDRDLLSQEKDGSQRIRLTLDREVENLARFRFRYRIPWSEKGEVEKFRPSFISPIDVPAQSDVVRVVFGTGIEVSTDAPGWDVFNSTAIPGSDNRGREHFRLVRRPGTSTAPEFVIRPDPVLPMPRLVASRLWLKTTQGMEGETLTTARFRIESHGSSIDLALPEGASWISAEVNDSPVPEIESLADVGSFRIGSPEVLKPGPLTLVLEYSTPPRPTASGFDPPRLLDGIIQQTYWEVRLGWNRMALGVPRRWNDENAWHWNNYLWKRRPTLSSASLTAWVSGNAAPSRSVESSTAESNDDDHSYLFSSIGEPKALSLVIQPRGLILGLCTGVVSLIGVVLVWLRLPGRFFLASLIGAGIGLSVVWDYDVAFTLLQSSTLGIALTGSASLLQWVVDRRRGGRSRFPITAGSTITPRAPSTNSAPTPIVGSDDSTAIRTRSSIDGDRLVLAPTGPSAPAPEGSGQGVSSP